LNGGDIHLWAEGDRLWCNAPSGALTPELRDRLQEHKKEILAFLRSSGEACPEGRIEVFGSRSSKSRKLSATPRSVGSRQIVPICSLRSDGFEESLTRELAAIGRKSHSLVSFQMAEFVL
jgi:hypothetical protein